MEPKPNTCEVEQTTPHMPIGKQNDQRREMIAVGPRIWVSTSRKRKRHKGKTFEE